MHVHYPYLSPEPESPSPRSVPFRPRHITLNVPYQAIYPSDEADENDFVHIPPQQELTQQPSPAELPGNTPVDAPLDAPPSPSTPSLSPTQTAAWIASDDGATVTCRHNLHHYTIPADVYLGCGDTACNFLLDKMHEKELLEDRVRELECAHEEFVREMEDAVRRLGCEAEDARWRLRRMVLGIRVLMRLEGLSLGDGDGDAER